MWFEYCVDVHDDITNLIALPDLECELKVSVEDDYGEPMINVEAVYLNGVDLLMCKGALLQLGVEIMSRAEDDSRFRDEVLEKEGISFHWRAPDDGRWVRAV